MAGNFKIKMGIVVLSLLFICCQNMFERDVEHIAPVATYDADMLVENLKNYGSLHVEEVVAVKGKILETNTKNGKLNVLIQGETNQNNYIICEMNDRYQNTSVNLVTGNTVVIKGILKGFLNDVILLNCVVNSTAQ